MSFYKKDDFSHSSLKLPGLTVFQVEPNSPAEQAGILPNDRIIEINDKKIRDDLDFKFREMESFLKIKFLRNGVEKIVTIEKTTEESIGIQLPPLSIRQCRNKCVFCFVDQQPQFLRKTLYLKDDDYRYSFLHGNFVTLTNVSEAELDRIVEEHLSPQYISVQVTDPFLHQTLLGLPKIDPILPKVKKLVDGGIQVHTQIVVVPDWNDKEVLEKSVVDLLKVLNQKCSIAIVPVGLTKYRSGLTPLRVPSKKEANELIEKHYFWRERSLQKFGKAIVYCADEWFTLAELEVPNHEYYNDYEQYENGVGMLRKLEVDTLNERPKWIKRFPRNVHWTWVTGKSAKTWLNHKIAPILLDAFPNLEIEIIEVPNFFWGATVTVANLLTGQDIWQTLEKKGVQTDLIVLPPDVINGDEQFIDDWTLADLQTAIVTPKVLTFPNKFAPLLRKMLTLG